MKSTLFALATLFALFFVPISCGLLSQAGAKAVGATAEEAAPILEKARAADQATISWLNQVLAFVFGGAVGGGGGLVASVVKGKLAKKGTTT